MIYAAQCICGQMLYSHTLASYPVPISIPTSARAEVGTEIGTGYEASHTQAMLNTISDQVLVWGTLYLFCSLLVNSSCTSILYIIHVHLPIWIRSGLVHSLQRKHLSIRKDEQEIGTEVQIRVRCHELNLINLSDCCGKPEWTLMYRILCKVNASLCPLSVINVMCI